MYPILARYGPFFLYSYTVVVGLGLAAAIALTAWLERRDGNARPGWIDALLVALFAGLAGGRAMFVWANRPYFQEQPGEIALVWQGGLSYHGFLIFGLLAFSIWLLWRRQSPAGYAGLLAPALALGSAFGWLACWFEGCAYGQETVLGSLAADLLLAGDLPDTFGVRALRYQTQLIGLALSLLALLLALLFRGRMRPGQLFWLVLLALSAGRIVVGLLRGDAAPMLGQWRLDVVADAFLALAAMVSILLAWLFGKVNSHRQLGTRP
jgi:phosphatidylglycerol:prolipoprotein diacylglycerol transferase